MPIKRLDFSHSLFVGFSSENSALKTLEKSVKTDEKLWNQVAA